jgi:hypothetical protein
MPLRIKHVARGSFDDKDPGRALQTELVPDATVQQAFERETSAFLASANDYAEKTDAVLRAALAHLWFVTIHAFRRWQWPDCARLPTGRSRALTGVPSVSTACPRNYLRAAEDRRPMVSSRSGVGEKEGL